MTNKHQQPVLNISKSILDANFLSLSQDWSLWESDLATALQHISETICRTLQVSRCSIWGLNQTGNGFVLINLYNQDAGRHSRGNELLFVDYPVYFEVLSENRVIDAVDAHSDYRTREFSEGYLAPNGIRSMLDATLRKAGQLYGVLCIEHTQGQRLWNEHEKRFAVSIADLIAQRLIYEDISKNESYYRELSAMQQAIVDGANYGIISTDPDGIIRTFNAAASQMLGFTKNEMIGLKSPEVFHDKSEIELHARKLSEELGYTIKPGFDVFVAKARIGIAEEREWTYIKKDGTRFPVLLSISAIRDDKSRITGYLGIAMDISDRVLTQRALREEEVRYRLLFESAGDSIFLMKGDLFVDCNPATLKMFGCTREQILQQPPYRFSPEYQPDGRYSLEKAKEKINAAFAGETQVFEWKHIRYDNTPFDAEVTLNAVEIHGEPHLLATVRNISSRKQTERDLENSRKQLMLRNENLSLLNELSNRLHVSPSIDTILEETLNALLGLTDTPHVAIYLVDENEPVLRLKTSYGFDDILEEVGETMPLEGSLSGLTLETGHILFTNDIGKDTRLYHHIQEILSRNKFQSGIIIPLLYQERAMGTINLIYRNKREISDVELETFEAIGKSVSISLSNTQQMQKLEIMAHHDSLTGLANRSLLHDHLNDAIENDTGISATLMLLDLDRFKEINDTLGHHIGDKLLQKIGPRLQDQLAHKNALLCRLGGDEFTILIYGEMDDAAIMAFSESILMSLRQPFSIESMILEIDVSIGIACYPADGENSHALLRSADVAMYEAKRKGGGIARYDRQADKHTPERLALIAELGTAIREDQLLLHYQPKYDLKSKQVTGFEALIRWQHPQMGLLYPDKFIHLAEVSDAIHALSVTVLELALAQQKRWYDEGYEYSVAVNLSVRNLIDDRCVNILESMLQKYQTRPGMLELEITETALMHDPEGAVKLLNQITDLGVRLSIDDFGTGYSSLSYLRKLPIDALKIDREFVEDMLINEQDAIIVRSTIALAHNLDLKVIAEGVENQATMDGLFNMGCDLIQGYHIHKPAEWHQIYTWLRDST